MSHDYYYRGSNDEEEEVIIQAVDNREMPVSIRVTESGGETSMIGLPLEEIDRMIAGLQKAKRKILAQNHQTVRQSDHQQWCQIYIGQSFCNCRNNT